MPTHQLYRDWRINGSMKYYQTKAIYRRLKLFYPQYQAWQRYFDMIPCEMQYSGWFVQDGFLWLPHTTLARMVGIKEINLYNRLVDAQFNVHMYPTYCTALPKSRYKAIWLNMDLLGAIMEINLLRDADSDALKRLNDALQNFEYDYHGKQPQPWCQTKLKTTIAGPVNIQKYLHNILAIEKYNHTCSKVVHKIIYKNNFFYSNLKEYPADAQLTDWKEHLTEHYPLSPVYLFDGFACDL